MGVIINRKRTFRQYLSLFKFFIFRLIKFFPYLITSGRRKLPDFLIIGVHKGGTTALYHYLNQHPEVQMSYEKETNFFTRQYYFGLRYYRSFFPYQTSKKMTGEASPYYLLHPWVPSRVKATLPEIKIILLLRDPVARAYSHYHVVKGIDDAADFKEAVAREPQRVGKSAKKLKSNPGFNSLSHQTYSYITTGLYYEQLSNWLKYFDRDQMLILKSEDFFQDTKKELKKVYSFLGLNVVYPKDLRPVNQRKYEKLPEDEYIKYKAFFTEDARKLKQLLGNHFSW